MLDYTVDNFYEASKQLMEIQFWAKLAVFVLNMRVWLCEDGPWSMSTRRKNSEQTDLTDYQNAIKVGSALVAYLVCV